MLFQGSLINRDGQLVKELLFYFTRLLRGQTQTDDMLYLCRQWTGQLRIFYVGCKDDPITGQFLGMNNILI